MEAKLAEKLGNGIEAVIAGEIADFGGLLTRHAAVLLLCRKNGIDVETKMPLSQSEGFRLPFSFEAKVARIFPVQSYPGRPDRSVRLHISDGSHEATLVLWNENALMAEQGGICAGDEIECHGAYSRSGEITLAKGGSVVRKKQAIFSRVSDLSQGICNVEGAVSEMVQESGLPAGKAEGAGEGRLSNGSARTAQYSFAICEKPGACVQVFVWSGKEGMQGLMPGDCVILENVVFKNSALHFNSFSRLVRRGGAGGEETATLERMDAGDGETIFMLGRREFRLGNDDAMAIIGLRKTVQGISAKTAIGIKAQELVGKTAAFRISGGKLCWLSFQGIGIG